MPAIDRYLPEPLDLDRVDPDANGYTWREAHAAERIDETNVACDSHLPTTRTERITEDGIWMCPDCGRLSDRIRLGGSPPEIDSGPNYELAAPAAIDSDRVVVISGFGYVAPSDDDDNWGHWSIPGFLVEVPFSANGVVKAWPEDAEPRLKRPQTWYRRYSEDFDHWAVVGERVYDFVEHMRAHDYIVAPLALPEE